MKFDALLKDDFAEVGLIPEPEINPDDSEDWEVLSHNDDFDAEDWVLPDKPDRIVNHGLLLKLNDISGQVSFCICSVPTFVDSTHV